MKFATLECVKWSKMNMSRSNSRNEPVRLKKHEDGHPGLYDIIKLSSSLLPFLLVRQLWNFACLFVVHRTTYSEHITVYENETRISFLANFVVSKEFSGWAAWQQPQKICRRLWHCVLIVGHLCYNCFIDLSKWLENGSQTWHTQEINGNDLSGYLLFTWLFDRGHGESELMWLA